MIPTPMLITDIVHYYFTKHFHYITNAFLSFIYFTSFRKQDRADINFLQWSTPVGLEPAYTCMWAARSTTVLQTPTDDHVS